MLYLLILSYPFLFKTSQLFKLLHLPTVALRNVIQLLNPIELFELSQCSRRALSIIPLSGSKKFKLCMNQFSSSIHINGYSFRIYKNSSQSEYSLHGNRTFMESTAKISHHSERELWSFWEDQLVGLKAVLFHLSKVFNCHIECGRFTDTIPAAFYMSIIDFISTRQSDIKKLHVNGQNLTDKNMTEIFDKLRVTDRLVIGHKFSVPPSIPLNHSKSIDIWNSCWITTEHLNSMRNSTVIQLDCSKLTDHDMTSFLNDWKSGKFPNLQYLFIQSRFLSKTFTAFGLPSLQDTVNPRFHIKTILGLPRTTYGAIDVQRDDGVVAKVSFNEKDGDLRILVL